MSTSGSKRAIIFAFGGNLLIAIIKYIVAFITGSAAMLAESIHSTADSMNQVLLLVGAKRAEKKRSEKHSFGFAAEIYFWSFIVAVLLFFVGGAFSIYEGINKVMHPHEITNIYWIFGVLIVSIIIEAKSFQVAYSEFKKTTTERHILKAIKASTHINLVVVVLEDSAAMLGLIVALVSTLLAWLVHPIFDAIGSILIGLLLVYISVLLIKEIHGLIIGESLPREHRQKIKQILYSHKMVKHVNKLQSMAMGDNTYTLLLSIDIDDYITSYQTEDYIADIKRDLKKELPMLGIIFIEVFDPDRN